MRLCIKSLLKGLLAGGGRLEEDVEEVLGLVFELELEFWELRLVREKNRGCCDLGCWAVLRVLDLGWFEEL
jgi:hypothetical protein